MENEYLEEEYQDDFDNFTQYENDDFNEQKSVEYLWARIYRPKTKSFLSVCAGVMPVVFNVSEWIKENWPDWNVVETFTENRVN